MGMGTRRPTLAILVSLCALMGVLASSNAVATATVTHQYLSQITEIPAGPSVALPGRLKEVGAMNVDSGKLYVGEEGGGEVVYRVDEFDAATGAFVSQFPQVSSVTEMGRHGIAAGHATGEEQVYVGAFSEGKRVVAVFDGEGHLLDKWSGSDTPGGAFVEVGGIAADNSTNLNDWAAGDVYVADRAGGAVDVFKPAAGGTEEYVTQLEPEILSQAPWAVAVDQLNGDVAVIYNRETIDVFEPTVFGKYALIRQLTGTPAAPFHRINSLAVDGGNGDMYVAEGESGIVYQFSETGQYLGRLTGTPTAAFRSVRSLAVDPATHDVYVGDFRETEPSVVDVYGPGIVIPDVVTVPVTEVKTVGEGQIEARLNGTVNPDKEGEASCQFVWGETREFGRTASCEPEEVADGESPVAVHATLGGAGLLAPDTTYYYRLQATNKNGTNPGEPGQDLEFTTPGPGMHGAAVSAVRAESVTFDAKIDPRGAPTSYYFQYGTSTAYGSDVPALSEGAKYGTAIGSGEGDVEVSQHVQGLSGATVYHYRVVVVSELTPGKLEYFYGPDQRFTTQTVGVPEQLPDGREWEMVSPPHKEGVLLGWIYQTIVQASSTGDAFTDWTSVEPTEDEAAGAYGFYESVFFGRGADGWTSRTITPPHSRAGASPVGAGGEYRFFSEDLSKAALQPFGPFTALTPNVTESTPYLRTDFSSGNPGELCTTGCYQPLVSAANVPPGTQFGDEPGGECSASFCGPVLLSGTPDLSHLILESAVALTATPLEGHNGLYEWAGGQLQLVNTLPQSESNEQGGSVSVETHLGSLNGEAVHAVSDDGSRIIWMGKTGIKGRHLYLRDTAKRETIRLDVFQGVEKGPEANYVIDYAAASQDGSRIFFLDGERLTPDATAEEQQPDLYEYDLNAPAGSRLTDLSSSAKPQEPAAVTGVPGTGDDGSYVYFFAPGALAPGATTGKCELQPTPGETRLCNLYVRHSGETTFIAGLPQDDFHDWGPLEQLPARVSPNGHWFAFMSDRNLTGHDTTDAVSKHPDEEVYLYDAVHDKLACASCNPTGARPVGVEYGDGQLVGAVGLFAGKQWVASNVPPWTSYEQGEARHQSRYLSDSGRLFFDSHDALVPQDVNGTQDVYEYEPVGIGDCGASSATFSESSGGCVEPVSSGTSNEESAFLDASETGGDVFFLTAAKLASQDFDNQLDIYDARECTASNACFAHEPVAPPACDTGEACKPAQSQQPTLFGSPSSATFSGAGNVAQPASGKASPKSVTRGQKLRRALRTCHRKKKHRRRMACERSAKHRYGAKATTRAASSPHDLSGRTGR
jgi:hypothetical protein